MEGRFNSIIIPTAVPILQHNITSLVLKRITVVGVLGFIVTILTLLFFNARS